MSGYRCVVELTKHHVSGILEGLTTTETMKFVSLEDAKEWRDIVNASSKVPYTVMKMKEL